MTDEEAEALGLLRAEVSAEPHDPTAPDGLPEVPGGWRLQELPIAGWTFRLWRPADPDASLDHADAEAWSAGTRDPYWVYLWPAAEKTVETLLGPVGPTLPGARGRVLELGCGIGLVGLAAGSGGATVTFSDIQADACRLAAINAAENGVTAETLAFDWADPPAGLAPFDLIVGSDLVYEGVAHDRLLTTLSALLAPAGRAVFGDPGRAELPTFLERADSAGFAVTLTDGAGRGLLAPPRPGFCVIELRRA